MSLKLKPRPSSRAAKGVAPLHESAAFLLRDLDRAIARELGRLIEPHGLTVQAWFVMRLIGDDEGLSQRELSQRVQVMETSSIDVLLRLERQGLIRRTRSKEDRRRVEVRLSAKGHALMQDLWCQAEAVNAKLLSFGSKDEATQLRRMLREARKQFP